MSRHSLNVYAKNHGNCRIVEFEGQKFAVVPDGLIGSVQFRLNSSSFRLTEWVTTVDKQPLVSGFREMDIGIVVNNGGQHLITGWRNGSQEDVVEFRFTDTLHCVVADIHQGEIVDWPSKNYGRTQPFPEHFALVDAIAWLTEPVMRGGGVDINGTVTLHKDPRKTSATEVKKSPLDGCGFKREGEPERIVLFFATESVLRELGILTTPVAKTPRIPVEPVELPPVKPNKKPAGSVTPTKWPWETDDGSTPVIFGFGNGISAEEWDAFIHPTKE